MISDKTLKAAGIWEILGLAQGLILFILLFVAAGCATPLAPKIVQPGDIADIHFLCRLKTGEIAAATAKLEGPQAALPKSTVFLLRHKDGPVAVTAGGPRPKPPQGREWSFEDEIINRMSGDLTGMKEGESRTVNLTAEDAPERQEKDYVVRIAREREYPKEMRMSVADYRSRTGKTPEEGQSIVFDPLISGRVKTVAKDEVTIQFSANLGGMKPTPFGPEDIRETEKTYEIVIDARKGALVRTGHLVGRIVDVDDKTITIDYRNPFGGETLTCYVKVEKVREKEPEKKAEEGSGR